MSIENQTNVVENATTPKTKKQSVKAVEKVEDVVENVEEVTDFKDENAKLKEQLKLQSEQLKLQSEQTAQLLAALKAMSVGNQLAPQVTITQPEEKKYRLVNLTSDHNYMTIRANGVKYPMQGYCTSRWFNKDDFNDIITNHGKLFYLGALSTDSDGVKLLEERGIYSKDIRQGSGKRSPKIANKWLTKQELDTVDELPEEDLTALFETLHPSQQDRLIDAFLEGFDLSEKQGFRDIKKLSALNKLYTRECIYKERLKASILKVSEN